MDRLLNAVGIMNGHGLGYTPESESEMERLALYKEQGKVKEISFHDGYQLPHFDIQPKKRWTDEDIALHIISSRSNGPEGAEVASELVKTLTGPQLWELVKEAAARGRSAGLGLEYKEKN